MQARTERIASAFLMAAMAALSAWVVPGGTLTELVLLGALGIACVAIIILAHAVVEWRQRADEKDRRLTDSYTIIGRRQKCAEQWRDEALEHQDDIADAWLPWENRIVFLRKHKICPGCSFPDASCICRHSILLPVESPNA